MEKKIVTKIVNSRRVSFVVRNYWKVTLPVARTLNKLVSAAADVTDDQYAKACLSDIDTMQRTCLDKFDIAIDADKPLVAYFRMVGYNV